MSVSGTGTTVTRVEVFLGSMRQMSLWPGGLPLASRGNVLPDLPRRTLYQLGPGLPTPGSSFASASPHGVFVATTVVQEY